MIISTLLSTEVGLELAPLFPEKEEEGESPPEVGRGGFPTGSRVVVDNEMSSTKLL